MNFLATHVMNIFGEFEVLVADIRAIQVLSEPLNYNIFLKQSVSMLFPQSNITWALSKSHWKWVGFMWNSPSIIYLDCLGSLACLLPVCNELEQIHLRRDMKGLEVGCLDQISDTCDPICRLSKYPFVSTFYGAYLKVACGTRGTGSSEKKTL